MAHRERPSTRGDSADRSPPTTSWTPFATNHSPQSSASSVRSLRKRHSFFGRASSDASRSRKLSILPSSSISEEAQQGQAPPRSNTALDTEQRRRRKTEPLESLRNSIFGSRRTPVPSGPRDRGDSNTLPLRPLREDDEPNSAVPRWSREHFRTKEDCKWLSGSYEGAAASANGY